MAIVQGDFIKVLVGQHKSEIGTVIKNEGKALIVEMTYGAIVKFQSNEIELVWDTK